MCITTISSLVVVDIVFDDSNVNVCTKLTFFEILILLPGFRAFFGFVLLFFFLVLFSFVCLGFLCVDVCCGSHYLLTKKVGTYDL